MSIASTTWERNAGTLPLLIAAPGPLWPVFVGRSVQWLPSGTAERAGAAAAFVVSGGAAPSGDGWAVGRGLLVAGALGLVLGTGVGVAPVDGVAVELAGEPGEVGVTDVVGLGLGVVSATAAAGIPRTRAASASGATRRRKMERCMCGTAFA